MSALCRTVLRPPLMVIVVALVLLTVSSALSADRSGNVATYRNDAQHKTDGERCLQILTEAGMKPAIVDGFFALVTVAPADVDRAQQLLGDAIEHHGLHVRRSRSAPSPGTYYEEVGYYRDQDRKDGERAEAVLQMHNIEGAGAGMSGYMSLVAEPERAAEARRLLSQAIKAENLRVIIKPAEEQNESPGALFFVRHVTIPADQAPDGRETTQLTVVRNVEVYPLTFSTEKVWSAEMPAAGVTTAWSPDARFLIFAEDPAGESTRLFYVDLTAARPQTSEFQLADAAQAAEARRSGDPPAARKVKYHTDLKSIAWSGPDVAKVQLTHGAGHDTLSDILKLDLAAAPPKLSIE